MRSKLFLGAVLVAALASPAAGQRGRRSDQPSSSRGDPGVPAGETRFTPALRSGQRLSVSNVDGDVTVTQGRGDRAEIVVTKRVRRGNGDLVKAVLEETSNGYRVCTVYLDDARDDRGCNAGNHDGHNDNRGRRESPEVSMSFAVRLPAGVLLSVNSVDGNIDARDIDAPATLRSVDGNITFDGVAPDMLNTVDGAITARITDGEWKHGVTVRSVDGNIELTLPASLNAHVSGHTVDGEIDSDFPVTISGKWGPQSFNGDIGRGRGESLELSTVDGKIRLRSSDGVRRGNAETDAPRRRGRGRP
jgi:hypothetical protein